MATPVSKFGGTYSGTAAPVSKFGGTYSGTDVLVAEEDLQQFGEKELLQKQERAANWMKYQEAEMRKEETGMVESTLANVGAGTQNIIRAGRRLVGEDAEVLKAEIEEEKVFMDPLREKYPISSEVGNIIGETVPFLPAAPFVGIGSLVTRLMSSGFLAAFETAASAYGKGKDISEVGTTAATGAGVGMALELVMPKLFGVGYQAYRQLTGKTPKASVIDLEGNPTPEFQKVLDNSGLTIEDLTDEAIQIAKGEMEGEVGAGVRSSVFNDLGITTSQSRVSQKPGDFAEERRLVGTEEGVDLQNVLAQESDQFMGVTTNLMNDLGYPEEVGNSIKLALATRLTGVKDNVDKAYRLLAEKSQGRGIPLFGTEIGTVFSNPKVVSQYDGLSQVDQTAVNDVMIKYGLDTDPGRVANWSVRKEKEGAITKFPIQTEVTPLNLLNFEQMNQDLNALMAFDNPNINSIVGSLKDGLNNELNYLDSILKNTLDSEGVAYSKEVVGAAFRARTLSREYFKLKSPVEIVGHFLKKKGGFDSDMLQAEQVWDKVKGGTRFGTIESANMLVRNLMRSGAKGKEALANMQSAVVADLIEGGFQQSKKIIGDVRQWSAAGFNKNLKKIGDEKLQIIFANNPKDLAMIRKLKMAGDSTIQPTSGERSTLFDSIVNWSRRSRIFSAIPLITGATVSSAYGTGAGIAAGATTAGINWALTKRRLNKLMSTSPVMKQTFYNRLYRYPNMMAIFGLTDMAEKKIEEQKNREKK